MYLIYTQRKSHLHLWVTYLWPQTTLDQKYPRRGEEITPAQHRLSGITPSKWQHCAVPTMVYLAYLNCRRGYPQASYMQDLQPTRALKHPHRHQRGYSEGRSFAPEQQRFFTISIVCGSGPNLGNQFLGRENHATGKAVIFIQSHRVTESTQHLMLCLKFLGQQHKPKSFITCGK